MSPPPSPVSKWKNEEQNKRPDGRADRLTGRGEGGNRARDGDEKRARDDARPHPPAAREERRDGNAVGGPHRPQVAAPDVRGRLTELSGDQHVDFYLYRKFVSPLDGMVYWIKVLPGSESATVNVTPGLADHTIISHTSVQAVQDLVP